MRSWAERNSNLVVGAALVALWLGVGTVLAVFFSGRIRDWSVMTDELLYAKLATSIAESGSPLPSVHGTSIAVYNQLYPLLLAPLYGTLSPPDAFRVAHVLNAFLMASAAFPAYLLARQVVGHAWSFGVAALSILVPWMIVTGFLMTEVVAYPAFLWAMLALQLAIAAPTGRRDLLAVGALALAIAARTQFAALAVVLPLAILGHEIGYARSLRTGVRAAFERHRVLAAVYALGVVAVALVEVLATGGVLGVYAVTVEEGSLLPSGVWSSAAKHLDAVAIGCGLAPFVLGGGWLLAMLARPRLRAEHAFATLALLTIAVLTFEVASFSVRFGADIIRDRYLFYVVPLLLVGLAAALSTARPRAVAIAAGVATLFFTATAASLPFTRYPGISVDTPASVLNDLLVDQSGELGTGTFVALLGLFTGLVLILGCLFAPRALVVSTVVGALGVFSVLMLWSEADRTLSSNGLSGRPLAGAPGIVLQWVDTVVPDGEDVALVALPVSTAWDTTAIRWWDVEFWNRSITRAYVTSNGHFTYTPFPVETLEINPRSGTVAGTEDAPRYHVVAPGDPRFRLAGSPVARNLGLVVRAVERPYRAVWATTRVEADGWTRPGEQAIVRVYEPGSVRVRVALGAPEEEPAGYAISSAEETRTGALEPGAGEYETFDLCVPKGSYAQLEVLGTSAARVSEMQLGPAVEGTRPVGVLLAAIRVEPLRQPC